ncbi:hypothetical protein ACFQ34_08730 [Pseudonocardia benzenivorans]|jgi:hypothetical protein|uniref:Uncharacterized protein n=2 Tax=Pseudonocardia TaxID=1847 RepID=F4CS83_PSEUX|nr:hypothetical protein [Pseudonocardia dioxanivorans]AEA22836.1 hypothetical protein Psed_0572 [Pseudonocardia dioxanivorans CB1190]
MNDDVESTVVIRPVDDVESTVLIRPNGPVFVDGTGRRRKRIKLAAYAAAATCALYMAVVGVSLAAHQETPLLPLPGLGSVAAGDPETAGILEAHDADDPRTPQPPRRTDAASRAVAPVASSLAPTTSPAPTSAAPTTTPVATPTRGGSRPTRTFGQPSRTPSPPADPEPDAAPAGTP